MTAATLRSTFIENRSRGYESKWYVLVDVYRHSPFSTGSDYKRIVSIILLVHRFIPFHSVFIPFVCSFHVDFEKWFHSNWELVCDNNRLVSNGCTIESSAKMQRMWAPTKKAPVLLSMRIDWYSHHFGGSIESEYSVNYAPERIRWKSKLHKINNRILLYQRNGLFAFIFIFVYCLFGRIRKKLTNRLCRWRCTFLT